jgi:hypothetical protein
MNRQRSFLIAFIFVLAAPTHVRAQAWSGILDPTRATDWSTAGSGAIPARTTICSTLGTAGQASTFVQSVTVSQINSALSSCPSGQAVLLNPGTYNTAGGTIMVPSNVTLRGSGPTQTFVTETATPSGTTIPIVQFGTQSSHPFGPEPNPSTSTAITGGTQQGSKQISVASASGIGVGTLLVLTQTDPGYMTDVGSSGTCTFCNGGIGGNSGQTVQVTAVNGTTLTISDPLYIAYTNSPLAFPFSAGCTSAGLENLHIYASGAEVINVNGVGYSPNINMTGTIYSWVKNVESDFTDGSHVHIQFSMHNTIRDSFFHDAYNHGPGPTDAEVRLAFKASANLIENNIFWRQHFSVNAEFGASGNVIAYNYSTGNYHGNCPCIWSLDDFDSHAPHPMMNLWEGNITTHWGQDQTWGSSSFNTLFRDYSTGSNNFLPPWNARGALQTGSPTYEFGNAFAFQPQSLTQFNNLVGIIDGSNQSISQGAVSRAVAPTSSSSTSPSCIQVGYNDNFSSPSSNNTDSTMLYHGVMDCNAGTFQWTTGVTQTLPASFYLSGKPSWWGSVAWPPIGPDITGGNFTDWQNSTATTARGHVNKIPAVNCFNSSTSNGTTNVTTFDANVCYTGSSGLAAPAPPTALAATVQ